MDLLGGLVTLGLSCWRRMWVTESPQCLADEDKPSKHPEQLVVDRTLTVESNTSKLGALMGAPVMGIGFDGYRSSFSTGPRAFL